MSKLTQKKERVKNPKGYSSIIIYEILRDEILSLDLAPCQPVDDASLAKRFNVSRSPVRDAMVRLVSESLLQTLPNKGTIVSPLRLEDFSKYIDALDIVQRTVSRLAAKFRNNENLELINKEQAIFASSVEANDILGMIQSNRDFHIAIAKAGNNRYFEKIYRELLDDGRRSLRIYFNSFDSHLPKNLISDHQLMIDAIKFQNLDLAEELAHEHTLQMQQQFLNYLGTLETSDIEININ
ncbi:MAG: DNA-binding GntR family transcriptional regulator [Brevundimonas sp.]|jgi:DNA-binding GntR family transcriptional regulator|tara:strand:- start:5058 stop:5774 length:717 start_codon:yes stop_codon:yes gene_type:complete